VYWCFHCYAPNPQPSGPCVRCGREVAAPAHITDEWRLVWALRHPDSDRAMLAAKTLGKRRATGALPTLREIVQEGFDPFLAAQALRSAIEIAGVHELADWLAELTHSRSFMVREVASSALTQAGDDA
jgi:HEAT repeat protein